MTTLDDLAEVWTDEDMPPVDRADLGDLVLTPLQRQWREHGVVLLPGFLDDDLIDAYCDEWVTHNAERPRGWTYCTPHRDHPALRNLVCNAAVGDVLAELLGEPAGVHLTLTGWRTTTRDWHADQYLNPPGVGGHYAAVWYALDTIHPDSGPFQWVPGSHRWPPLSQAKVRAALGEDGTGPMWPTHSERLLTPLYTERIDGHEIHDHLPNRGDVLLWHSRLVHRGSVANDPDMERRALIAHYSGIRHRYDMPAAYPTAGGWMFPVDDRNGWE